MILTGWGSVFQFLVCWEFISWIDIYHAVAQSYPTIWDTMDASFQASLFFNISWSLFKLTSTNWWCHPTISSFVIPFSSCLQSCAASGSFPVSRLFSSEGQSIGISASASVLPVNIQSRFSLGLIDLISLQSKGLSRVFSSTTVWKRQLSFVRYFFCIYLNNHVVFLS